MVLSVEGGTYLPPIGDANKDYIKSIMTGKKRFIYCKNVISHNVPHIESLSIKEILKFARDHTIIDDYLPVYKYNKFPNRVCLCNVVNTIANKEFIKFIDKAMENRQKEMAMKMKLNLDAILEIVNIFSKSNNVSYMKGRIHFLMRSTNNARKRKYADIEMDNKEEETKEISKVNAKIKDLENEIDEYKRREELFLKDKEKLMILYQEGYINSDGEPITEKE